MNNIKSKKGLDGKDLMNVGIFTAVYLVIYILVSIALGLIPIVSVTMSFVSSIILGIPMMLYFTKIKTFGMVTITYIVNGIIMALLGLGIYPLIIGTICALIAELILRWGEYQSANKAILAFAFACMGGNANILGWVTASTEFLEQKSASMGADYIYTVAGYFRYWWVTPVIILSAFGGGLIGGFLGKSILKKHFIRSGLV
ncbi:MAG: MptD family putative ECF transporter S component [Lachnospiraceae bacterium]